MNIDLLEIEKFSQLAQQWWDLNGPLRTLHDLNPARLSFIEKHTPVAKQLILDVGCGGGILTESLAKLGGIITGIDASSEVINAARHHANSVDLAINYVCTHIEDFSADHLGNFDMVTCLELLEHTPEPASIIKHCLQCLKPGGKLFISTINRTAKAYLKAIIGAEYCLKLLPVSTHDYDKFIRPTELTQCLYHYGAIPEALTGLHYNPFSRQAFLIKDVSVNYILMATQGPLSSTDA